MSLSPPRTLLLAPPSIASHPSTLASIEKTHDRSTTDMQMLDRIALQVISLPTSTYSTVLLLPDPSSSLTETFSLLTRPVIDTIVSAMAPGATLTTTDRTFAVKADSVQRRESVLAGLVWDESDKVVKKAEAGDAIVMVPLKLRRTNGATNGDTMKRKSEVLDTVPNGVGFDYGESDDDDDIIDENTLLDDQERNRPMKPPTECLPKLGKRRRACADCTCGLAARLAAEDAQKRSAADASLATLTLAADDLNEVDFTVKGKVGSCGNCALGDAFRCEGCPYVGMPAFKPGEEVRLVDDRVEL
ncbi:MAG: electron carrier [Vezdaea aestivalis]|nr:MAG: electron carrier [Vezdaea aestivalis]